MKLRIYMKRKFLLIVFFVMTTFLSAEQFKGVLCFNLNDNKTNVKKLAEENGFILNQVNSNCFEINDIKNRTYASRNVKKIKLAFWNDRLVWIELYLGSGNIYDDVSSKDEIISAICKKYDFIQDKNNSDPPYYINYISTKTGISFNCESTSLISHNIEIRFCYLEQFLLYKNWRDEIESKDRKKLLNDSI